MHRTKKFKQNLLDELEKIVRIYPAYDNRHPDPAKNYGIHGAEMGFYLKGKKGAVQFLLYTNWHLPHIQKELSRERMQPQPVDLGYHSPKPTYKGHTVIDKHCEFLDGKKCYYDGSTSNAYEIFNILVKEGDEGMWKELDQYYKSCFDGKD